MKKRIIRSGIIALVMSTMIMGCGADKSEMSASESYKGHYGNSSDIYLNSATTDSMMEYDMYEESPSEEVYEEAPEAEAGAVEVPNEAASNRKLIRNVSMEIETEEFDPLMAQLENKVKALGGYIEQSSTYNGSSYSYSEMKNANLTIRIPAEKLDEFLSAIAERSNVTSKDENVTDVTLQYVDLESHKKVLLAEQERLLEMMDKAETIEDMIAIESRLSEVRYQIESQESQLRTYDNQIQYSTVYLNISEVKKYTPVAERTFWEKISEGFVDSLLGVAEDLVDLLIWFITNLPYLVVWCGVLAVIIRFIIKGIGDKKERKERGIDKKTQRAERKEQKKQKKLNKKAKKVAENMDITPADPTLPEQ